MIDFGKNIWLGKTHQLWKVWLFLSMIILDLSLFVLMILKVNNPEIDLFGINRIDVLTLGFIFMLLTTFSFCWLMISIKCPKCDRRPVYQIMKTSDFSAWTSDLFFLKFCPYCYNLENETEIFDKASK